MKNIMANFIPEDDPNEQFVLIKEVSPEILTDLFDFPSILHITILSHKTETFTCLLYPLTCIEEIHADFLHFFTI